MGRVHGIIRTVFVFFRLIRIQILFYFSHPISIGLILVLLSILSGAILIKMNITWFFYLLVLVFLGGVIVLIIYISTLAANEKFFLSVDIVKRGVRVVVSLATIIVFYQKYVYVKISSGGIIASVLYEGPNTSLLVFLIFYLLLTLVAVVKLVKFESGPSLSDSRARPTGCRTTAHIRGRQ